MSIQVRDADKLRNCMPVLVDDIISTGHTMIETVKQLRRLEFPAPYCIGIHGIFAENADKKLLDSGVEKIVTTNSIVHSSNGIDLSPLLIEAVEKALASL